MTDPFLTSLPEFTDGWGRRWRKLACGHWRNESHFEGQQIAIENFCWKNCHEKEEQHDNEA